MWKTREPPQQQQRGWEGVSLAQDLAHYYWEELNVVGIDESGEDQRTGQRLTEGGDRVRRSDKPNRIRQKEKKKRLMKGQVG